ncbi:EI24 domain-containing protein [Caldimonas brevitalea]|uniref:Etoposide-induced protein 2.4 (EI24) n=1 Tax=Caldimonas brevitalea TaxID=413882 RepID=A0A0G3BKA0_9BURK|nr:EI24 domain-containing protein [Caldimonas brevitalea]AKJ29889.1 hypothetical protein AAW51_3198 [Caldimonas brevitalea]
MSLPKFMIFFPSSLRFGLSEAAKSFALGLRECARPRLALVSVVAALVSLLLWLTVFVTWWEELVQLALVGLVVLAVVFAPAAPLAGSVVAMGSFASVAAPVGLVAVAAGVLKYVVVAAAFAVLVLVTMRLVVEWWLMPRIQQACLERYPALRQKVDASWHGGLRNVLGAWALFLVGGTICLLIPFVGAVLLFLLANYLNARSLVNDALDGIANDVERRKAISENRVATTAVGVMVAGFTLIPFAGLLAPVLLGAAMCHLSMRTVMRVREQTGSAAAATGSASVSALRSAV